MAKIESECNVCDGGIAHIVLICTTAVLCFPFILQHMLYQYVSRKNPICMYNCTCMYASYSVHAYLMVRSKLADVKPNKLILLLIKLNIYIGIICPSQ